MWLQFDWGEGPRVPGADGVLRGTFLFCAWLAWSRFRMVIPVWDQTLPTLIACLDQALRRIDGVPTYILTDNAKTVSIDHVAGVAVRHPQIVAAGRRYGTQVHTCVPFDPESKGGTDSTVRLAKADVVPTQANLRAEYDSIAELEAACEAFCAKVNGRVHRKPARVPAEALVEERVRLHVLPAAPHTLALGQTRMVNTDHTVRYGSVRYSTSPGLVGTEV
ncbi:MAG TPA: DDE-type integrase/transposase/recombinase [Candidatus Yaniella excrementigallinarum]|nr:DDE-type integrase/transposase/recombinase [Candidatus Yaniella excrementigallinarum]